MLRLAVLTLLLAAGCLESGESGPGTPGVEGDDACGPRPDRERLGQDWSKETLVYAIESDGPFQVDLPVPVSDGGTQAADWLANARASDGWTAILEATQAGQTLRVTGQGNGEVRSCSIQPQSERGNGCCAEQYLDAHWTGSNEARSEMGSLDVEVWQGAVGLRVLYTAESNWCGAEAEFSGMAPEVGHHSLAGGHQAWCE
ncbi:MAG: hypothetical protein WC876_10495 [Candidatus Thermoplasmatota archaeon]|jgi:hypothetical protein